MSIETKGYSRKPFHVDAVQVTEENMEEVAAWCKGEIRTSKKTIRNDENEITERKEIPFIKVEVHRPLNDRQTKAYAGDWVLLSDAGFKVYTQRAFDNAFEQELVYTEADAKAQLEDAPTDGRERFPEPTTTYTEADSLGQLGMGVPEIKLTLEGSKQ
jgi:hypothetical protein